MPGIRKKLFSTSFFKEKTFGLIEATEAVEAMEANEVENVVEVKKSLIVWILSSFCIFWGQRVKETIEVIEVTEASEANEVIDASEVIRVAQQLKWLNQMTYIM